MIGDVVAALSEVFSAPFRSVLWKVLGLTVALLALAVVGLHRVVTGLLQLPYPWLQTTASVIAGLGLLVGSIFFVAPVSALVAGFFVDELAELVERDIDPGGTPGQPLSIAQSAWLGVRFGLLSLAVTLLALILLLVPGINAVAFLAANSYLLGRQYFEFAALRFRPVAEVTALRRANWLTVLTAGLCVALFVSVPLLNLLTPLFGTSLLVRVHRRVSVRTVRLAPRV